MGPARATLVVASLLLVAARPARSDEQPIVADRPGYGESASVVATGHLQLETGAAWTRVDDDTTTLDAPQLLLRIGLPGPLELRVAAPDRIGLRASSGRTGGWTDTSLGVKGHWAARGHDFSLRASAYLPTGSSELTSHRLDPELALAWSHALSGPWSLGATISQRWQREVDQAFTSPSLSLGRSLGASAGSFLEYGAIVSRGEAPVHRFDHGYTWTPNPRTQLDVSLGIALSRASTTFFVGAGICHRF